jgi:gluconate 5-dehydrogenase
VVVTGPIESLHDLSGRTALVTGASSGLGVTFARGLAYAGANVVVAARRADRLDAVAEEIRASGTQALAVPCDVTDAGQVARLVDQAVERFGRIDVLVANAGQTPEGGVRPERVPNELFEQSLRVNVMGTWHCCREVGARMLVDGKGGSIITMSSVAGLGGQQNFPVAYQTAKAAIINLTRNLACSWADRGVRVNALAPGWFPSEMTDAWLAVPVWRARVEGQAAMGRVGDPQELVGPLLFLASPASSYVTGHALVVDGGTSASYGADRYGEALFGLHAAAVPDGLGERVLPA